MHSDYIVFVDESGDHSMVAINPDFPVFVLAFCILRVDDYINVLTARVRKLKFDLFGHDQVILHERDIRKRSGPFSSLGGPQRDVMMTALNEIISDCPMSVVAVVINKSAHKEKYVQPEHPYHLAMQYGLERVHRAIPQAAQAKGPTNIICECRGAKEDRDLELEFRRVCAGQNYYHRPFNFKIVMSDKRANSEGLQLADLLARPIGLRVMRPSQENRSWDIIETKMFRSPAGVVHGHGLKVFP